MSLTNAECVSETVREDGRVFTQLTLTGALSGFSQDSLMQKGLSKLSRVSEMGVARFKAVLRTENAAEAAEWCAVLRHAALRSRAVRSMHAMRVQRALCPVHCALCTVHCAYDAMHRCRAVHRHTGVQRRVNVHV